MSSRVLLSGKHVITHSFADHKGWAKGVDVVSGGYSLSRIINHTRGVVIKVVKNLKENYHGLDAEGMGYGNYVVIKHTDTVCTLYAHLSSTNLKVGDVLSAGSVVGYMGSTGNSTGAHLHFEIRVYNSPVDTCTALHDTSLFTWLNPESYLDSNLPVDYDDIVKPKPAEIYRVRKSWDDDKSQMGAYYKLEGALKIAQQYHMNVYDSSGKCIKSFSECSEQDNEWFRVYSPNDIQTGAYKYEAYAKKHAARIHGYYKNKDGMIAEDYRRLPK